MGWLIEASRATPRVGLPLSRARRQGLLHNGGSSWKLLAIGKSDLHYAGIAYGVNLPDLARQTATHVDKILKGAKPAELPVEQPTKFELVINLKTARDLSLTITREVLLIADDVIE